MLFLLPIFGHFFLYLCIVGEIRSNSHLHSRWPTTSPPQTSTLHWFLYWTLTVTCSIQMFPVALSFHLPHEKRCRLFFWKDKYRGEQMEISTTVFLCIFLLPEGLVDGIAGEARGSSWGISSTSTVPVISTPHAGQVLRSGPHPRQQTRWSHGRNTTVQTMFACLQNWHRRSAWIRSYWLTNAFTSVGGGGGGGYTLFSAHLHILSTGIFFCDQILGHVCRCLCCWRSEFSPVASSTNNFSSVVSSSAASILEDVDFFESDVSFCVEPSTTTWKKVSFLFCWQKQIYDQDQIPISTNCLFLLPEGFLDWITVEVPGSCETPGLSSARN